MSTVPLTGPAPPARAAVPVVRLSRVQQRIRAAGLPDVLRVTAQQVLELCGADLVIVSTSDDDGTSLVAREVCGSPWTGAPHPGDRVPLEGSLAGLALTTGVSRLCVDGADDARSDARRNARFGIGSSLAVPLTRDGEVVGVVSVLAREPGRFDAEDLAAAELTCGTASDRLAQLVAEFGAAELHRTVLDALDEAILVTRGDELELLHANHALRRMGTGTDVPEPGVALRDMPWTIYDVDGRLIPQPEQPTAVAWRTGKGVRDVVLRHGGPDGRGLWFSVTALPVRDPLSHQVLSVVTRLRDVTDERRDRDLLETSKERLRAAQHVSGLAWWSYDATADTHSWSEQMFEIAGLDRAGPPPCGAGFLALIHPDDRPASFAAGTAHPAAADAVTRPHSRNQVFRLVRPDGEVRVVQSWSDREHAPDGRLLRIYGASLDVTDRERALAELGQRDQRFRLAFDNSPIGMGLIDVAPGREPSLVRANDALVALLGHRDEADLVGRAVSWSVPSLVARDRALLGRVVAGEVESLQMETVLVRRDGSTFPALVTGSVSGQGADAVLLLHVLDLTERQRAVEEVERSEQLFRAAFEHAPSGMVVVSAEAGHEGRVLRANRAMADLVGLPVDQTVGKVAQDFLVRSDREASFATLARVATSGNDSGTAHRRLQRPDGTQRDVYVSSTSLSQGEHPTVLTHVVDVTQQQTHQRTLEQMAMTDSMTGLANRVQLAAWLELAMAGPAERVALLMLDLDRFKNVNDSLGHDVGDQLLQQVADRLSRGRGRGWRVARLGGDEFVVLLVDVDGPDHPQRVAEEVLEAVAQPYQLESGHRIETTVSVGIALGGHVGPGGANLLRQADLALYAAKDAGRNRFAVCDAVLLDAIEDKVRTETRLRRALDHGHLRVHLQPIVDLDGGALVALEALVRLDDPVEGLLPPARFIDVAEESGLITEVDRFVLAEALRIAAEHPLAVADPSVRIAVNLSSRTLAQGDLAGYLRALLQASGVPGSRLLLEVTESGLLADDPALHRLLEELTALGAQLAIDDFGTGYSALAYLTRFRMHKLKIDRAFVSDLDQEGGVAEATVRAIIQLAHAHGMRVTAEGVETREQADVLRGMGCDSAQGWLFGRPQPAWP